MRGDTESARDVTSATHSLSVPEDAAMCPLTLHDGLSAGNPIEQSDRKLGLAPTVDVDTGRSQYCVGLCQ